MAVPEKLTIINENTQREFKCKFNPTEYSISKSNRWGKDAQTGKDVPQFDFQGGDPRSLTLQLLFDSFEEDQADITTEINALWDLVTADRTQTPAPKDNRFRPPLVRVQWGNHWEFKAAITSLKVRYQMFREDGRPVRATVDATFVEAVDESQMGGTNPSSQAEPGHRRRTVEPHDTLAWIAYEEYGDSGQWRRIADVNRLDDPLDIHPGQILAIPPQP